MTMTPKLTKSQQDTLDAIEEFVAKNGYPPVLRELCDMTGKKSPATIFRLVSALEQKGFVKTTPGQMRSIRLCSNPIFTHVVTCKNCKHRYKSSNGVVVWNTCNKLGRQMEDDFYCAYGEEKD